MTVLLLNPNTDRATTAEMVAIARLAGPSLSVEGRTAPFGVRMIVEPVALAEAGRAVA